jgi:DNA-binding NtrC family response regulator
VRTLALRYTAHFADRHGRRISAITAAALERLEGYGWPGNVRELRNVIDRAVLLAGGPVLRTGHLRLGAAAPRASARGATNDAQAARPNGYPTSFSLDEVEADHIARVLEARNGHVRETAEILGIHRNTLARKLLHHTIGTAGPEEA